MRRKTNKPTKKVVTKYRDHRKFIIVAEGEREDNYFAYFNNINQRIKVNVVPRDQGKSACKFFIERLDSYDKKHGIEKEDIVWFVLDVDKWVRTEIQNLIEYCTKNGNCFIAISNPCFEVWLYYHFGNPQKLTIKSSRALKTALGKLIHGGYQRDVFAKEIAIASKNAHNADEKVKQDYPDIMRTKVYKLANEMLKFLGKNWNK